MVNLNRNNPFAVDSNRINVVYKCYPEILTRIMILEQKQILADL